MNRVAILAACLLAVLSCEAFIGPATKLDETYYFKCGEAKCRIGYDECSKTKPLACRPLWVGVSRDAGAE